VLIRELTPGDLAEVVTLLDQLGYPTTAGQLGRRASRVRESGATTAVVAVAADGRVVGLASLTCVSLLTDDAPYALLTSAVVHEDVRGSGVGRALVEHLAERATAHGCEHLSVNTHVRRAGAHAFYERLGFEFTGRRYAKDLGSQRLPGPIRADGS
jgi:predicted N-acetyltransferase YhbS